MIKLSNQILIFATYGLVNSRSQAYTILGLQEGASLEEVKTAFKNKALKLHPDRNPDPNALKDMQLLNAAKDFILNNEQPQEVVEGIPQEDMDNPFDLSYEEISELRDRMGREEFDKKFPGWKDEIMREMGLDAYNKLFEKYDPTYNPEDDPYFVGQMEQLWDHVKGIAEDIASALYEKGMEDHVIDVYTNTSSLMEKYPNLVEYPEWIDKKGFSKDLLKAIDDKFNELLLENIGEFDIPFDYIIEFPNEKVINAFLAKEGNIAKYDFPDDFLTSKNFGRAFIFLLREDPETAEIFINKYKDNKAFMQGLVKSVGFLHYMRDNAVAKMLLKLINFDEEQRKLINRWLTKIG